MVVSSAVRSESADWSSVSVLQLSMSTASGAGGVSALGASLSAPLEGLIRIGSREVTEGAVVEGGIVVGSSGEEMQVGRMTRDDM